MHYYQRLRDCREDADQKQAAIAALLGITQQQYSLYERGKSEIPLYQAATLADFYQVSLDYLAGRTNHAENPNL